MLSWLLEQWNWYQCLQIQCINVSIRACSQWEGTTCHIPGSVRIPWRALFAQGFVATLSKTYPKDYVCLKKTAKSWETHQNPWLRTLIPCQVFGYSPHWAGSSHVLEPLHCRDRYAGVSRPKKSTLLWSNADSTVDAGQWSERWRGQPLEGWRYTYTFEANIALQGILRVWWVWYICHGVPCG